MYRFAALSAAAFATGVDAQRPPMMVEGYTAYPQRACAWSAFTQGTDWAFASTESDDATKCAAACDSTDGCTAFEIGPSTSAAYGSVSYCALWFNGSCSSDDTFALSSGSYTATTFEKDAVVTATEVAKEEIATTTAAVTLRDSIPQSSTVEATTISDGLYVLKYPQQACQWNLFIEGEDWQFFSTESSDSTACAAGCVATEGCTGFEVGSDSGSSYGSGPYCALWLNGACSVPDESFYGLFSAMTGAYIEVDTYTLADPIDAFQAFEHRSCAWANFEEDKDWGFVSKDSADEEACAKLCLESTDGCTGFEVGAVDTITEYGDLTQGYCALWYNNSCTPSQMLSQHTEASTYLLITADDCGGSSHVYYFMFMIAGLMICLMACCCCRRAAMRRRMALRRARAAVATRAAPGTAPVASVSVEGQSSSSSRAVVYAVQISDVQQEPAKE